MTNLEQTKGDQHAILVVDSMALLQDLQMVRRYKKIFHTIRGIYSACLTLLKGGGWNEEISSLGNIFSIILIGGEKIKINMLEEEKMNKIKSRY